MLKKLLSDSAILVLANVLNKAKALLLFPIISHHLSLAEYGIIAFAGVLFLVSTIVLSVGTHQGLLRFFNETESHDEKCRLCSSVFFFNLAIAISTVLVVVLGNTLWPEVFGGIWGKGNTVPIALAWAFQFLQLQTCTVLRSQLKVKLIAWVSLCTAVTFTIMILVLSGIQKLDSYGYWLSMAVGNGVGFAVSLKMAKGYLGGGVSFAVVKKVARFSWPLALATLSAVAWMATDRLIVKLRLDADDLGVIGVAYQFASVVSIVTAAIGQAIAPLVYSKSRDPELGSKLSGFFELFSGLSLLGMLGLIFLSDWILNILAPEEFGRASLFIPSMAMLLLVDCLARFFPGLYLAGKTQLVLRIQLLAFGINLGLSLLFVQRFGLVGVTIASVITATVYVLMFIRKSRENFPMSLAWPGVVAWGGLIGLAMATPTGIFSDNWGKLLIGGALVGVGLLYARLLCSKNYRLKFSW